MQFWPNTFSDDDIIAYPRPSRNASVTPPVVVPDRYQPPAHPPPSVKIARPFQLCERRVGVGAAERNGSCSMLVWTTARFALPVSIRTMNGSPESVFARSAGYDVAPAGHFTNWPAVVR